MMNQISTIIFDFDGVILDSMPVREVGFVRIFNLYPKAKVDQLLEYHRTNGGLSRYHKIRYFYEAILNKRISEQEIINYAELFSEIMRDELKKSEYIIHETLTFIKDNFQNHNYFIASGSDQNELRYLCKQHKIDRYFKGIYGSPTHKNDIVKEILISNNISQENVVLIGDSINDYEAAKVNRIKFFGYNNSDLKTICDNYIDSFRYFK